MLNFKIQTTSIELKYEGQSLSSAPLEGFCISQLLTGPLLCKSYNMHRGFEP